jgi:hypothetical protein
MVVVKTTMRLSRTMSANSSRWPTMSKPWKPGSPKPSDQPRLVAKEEPQKPREGGKFDDKRIGNRSNG